MSFNVPQNPRSSQESGGLWGVVLVGGRSSRMGRDKAALPHPAGGTFLDHAIRCLRELGLPVMVAGTREVPAAWAGDPSVTAHPDPPADGRSDHAGPVAGIVAALRHSAAAGASGILVRPVDMPYLTRDDLRGILTAFAEQNISDTTASVSSQKAFRSQPLIGTSDGVHREPLVAIYPLAMLEPLQQLAASHDRSLNRWLATQPHRLHRLPAAATANINTPDQYERATGSAAAPISEDVSKQRT